MTGYADLADYPEAEQIDAIGMLAAQGSIVGFVVDDEEKADRYLIQLHARHRVRLVGRGPGPVAGSILVRVGPIES